MKQRTLLKTFVITAIAWLSGISANAQEAYAVVSEDGGTVTFYYDTQKESRGGSEIISNGYYDIHPYESVATATFDASMANYRPSSTAYWFYECSRLTTISGMEHLNTTDVTDMSWMFYGCSSLTNLDVKSFNTSEVTNMAYMFSGCSALTDLDLSSFKTENVQHMSGMFEACASLTSLDVSNFSTSNVITMSYMFAQCSSLVYLDLSHFDTGRVNTMRFMFAHSSLQKIDLSSFNTLNVTDMVEMFYHCSSLTSIDLSNFNTINVTEMYNMFEGCSSLTSLDLSNLNTKNVTLMHNMFSDCSSLNSLDLSSFNTEKVTQMYNMFSGCSSLKSIYVDEAIWSTENIAVGAGYGMFFGCYALVGGNGTAYESYASPAGVEYARVDKENQPGYFTQKSAATGIDRLSTVGNADGGAWYTLDGQRVGGEPKVKGIYVREGRKVIVK